MKSITKYFLCIALVFALIVLPSCSMFWSSSPSYSGGQMLDNELMSSIRAEVIGEKTETAYQSTTHETTKSETEPDKTEAQTESSTDFNEESSNEEITTKGELQEVDSTVYWTNGGGVYHLYKDCGYIKSSSEVSSGTVDEAVETGKSGVCSRCQGRKDKE